MKERRRWSPQQIAQFEGAWNYLEGKSPEIKALCAEFNETNGKGLVTAFWAVRLQWGLLLGCKPASGEKRAQRIINDVYNIGNGVSLAVSTLTDEEANTIGEFAARISNDFNLRVRKEWESEKPGREVAELRYSIKPIFEQFR